MKKGSSKTKGPPSPRCSRRPSFWETPWQIGVGSHRPINANANPTCPYARHRWHVLLHVWTCHNPIPTVLDSVPLPNDWTFPPHVRDTRLEYQQSCLPTIERPVSCVDLHRQCDAGFENWWKLLRAHSKTPDFEDPVTKTRTDSAVPRPCPSTATDPVPKTPQKIVPHCCCCCSTT
eukprot:scaffold10879_cov45-Attheya_sp.AAC.3